MPRANHTAHALGFPVYSLAFLSDDTLVFGGGGGAGSKSGVKNRLRVVKVKDAGKALEKLSELELEPGEDAPMAMGASADGTSLAAGINSPLPLVQSGSNRSLRLYTFSPCPPTLTPSGSTHVSASRNSDSYQRVASFSPSPNSPLLAAAAEQTLRIIAPPSLAARTELAGEAEILDVSWDAAGERLAVTTEKEVSVFSLVPDEKTEGSDSDLDKYTLNLLQTLSNPLLAKEKSATFRFARFSRPSPSPVAPERLYTIVNAGPPLRRGAPRRGLLTAWDTDKWAPVRTRALADRPVTAFDVSADGGLIAFASADLSVGVVSAWSLAPLIRILSAHSFPVTTLAFNPSASLLASASPDNSMRIVEVPEGLAGAHDGNRAAAFSTALLLALLALLLAIAYQMYVARS